MASDKDLMDQIEFQDSEIKRIRTKLLVMTGVAVFLLLILIKIIN